MIFLLFYIALLLYILFKEPLVLIAFYFLFFSQTFIYLSVVILDFGGVTMSELGEVSEPSHTSFIVFLFNIIATLVIFTLLKLKKRDLMRYIPSVELKRIPNVKYWVIGFYIVIVILIINVVVSGSPLWVSTINKTTFWLIAKFPFLKPVSSQISVIALFSGMFLLNNTMHKKSSLVRKSLYGVYISLLVYLILLGHKFGQLVVITVMFFLPLLIYQSLKKTLRIRRVIFYLLIFFSLLAIPVSNYFVSKYGNAAFEIIRQRIFAMEGQLSYVAIQKLFQGHATNRLDQLIVEIKYIFGLVGQDTYVGMTYLMSQFMPGNQFAYYQSLQVNLAGGYIATLISLYSNIVLVLFVHTIFIMLFFIMGYMLIINILKYNLLLTFIYLKLYFSFYAYYAQGYTTAILNVKTLIYIYLIILIMMVRKINHKKVGGVIKTV